MPEVRCAARDVTGTLVLVVAGLTAFTFLNVAASDGLSKILASWLAALVLAAVWMTVAGVLLFGFMGRARQWLSWIILRQAPTEAVEELERERDTAGKAARSRLERLGPALAVQVALAAVPDAGDVATGVVEVGGNVLEASDEIVEVVAEQLPAAAWSIRSGMSRSCLDGSASKLLRLFSDERRPANRAQTERTVALELRHEGHTPRGEGRRPHDYEA